MIDLRIFFFCFLLIGDKAFAVQFSKDFLKDADSLGISVKKVEKPVQNKVVVTEKDQGTDNKSSDKSIKPSIGAVVAISQNAVNKPGIGQKNESQDEKERVHDAKQEDLKKIKKEYAAVTQQVASKPKGVKKIEEIDNDKAKTKIQPTHSMDEKKKPNVVVVKKSGESPNKMSKESAVVKNVPDSSNSLKKASGVYFPALERKIDNSKYDQKFANKRDPYSYKSDLYKDNKSKEKLARELFFAVQGQDIGAIKGILATGVNVDATNLKNGYTPIMYAVQNNFLDSLRYLLHKGANPNKSANDGVTPLHLATFSKNLKAVRILLEFDANIFAQDMRGKTFFEYLSQEEKNVVINDIFEVSQTPDAALLDFVRLGSKSGVIFALENGASINAANKIGETALMFAIRYYSLDMINYILSKGSDISKKNVYGMDAATIAKLNNKNKVYSILETVRYKQEIEAFEEEQGVKQK